ncbi:hypothetical protein HOY82DRAFT_418394 [Tuber indicum]|nr:hypothetical protein HOY82DRAFT_418394 [Tuber indicum]
MHLKHGWGHLVSGDVVGPSPSFFFFLPREILYVSFSPFFCFMWVDILNVSRPHLVRVGRGKHRLDCLERPLISLKVSSSVYDFLSFCFVPVFVFWGYFFLLLFSFVSVIPV